MVRATIARILDIEKEAVDISANAEKQAKAMLSRVRKSVAKEKKQTLRAARAEAAQLIAAGKEEAAAVRARILAAQEAESAQMVEQAGKQLQPAVEFVLDEVLGV